MEAGVLALVTVSTPKDVDTKAEFEALTYFEQESWKFEMKSYNDVKMKTKKKLLSVYFVIWGQLTKGLQNRIMADSSFTYIKETEDAIRLLGLVDNLQHDIGD